MSKKLILLAPALLAFAATLAQTPKCNYNYLGTKTLYQAPVYKPSALPLGYHAVFINHVGRHGARHLTKEVNTSFAWKLVARADSAKGLTSQGQKLWQTIQALNKVEHGQVKSISVEGRNELAGIGNRMATRYASVFPARPVLNVTYTKEVRTVQSADAFLLGLKAGFTDSASIKRANDDIHLRFYDAAPAYVAFEEHGPWEKPMEKLKLALKIGLLNKQITARWLKSAYQKNLSTAQQEELVNDIFGFATIVRSLESEVKQAGFKMTDVDFASLFTCAELTALSKIDVADDYLKKAPGIDANGVQVRIAVPLLVDFINTTDDFLKTHAVNANLRFAHAETVAPFAALLGLKGAAGKATDLKNLSASWQSSKVVPLSANVQWVFFSSGTNDLLVKILLNEKEVTVNGLPATGGYYHWSALRTFYITKLQKLGVGLGDDMEAYLKGVK